MKACLLRDGIALVTTWLLLSGCDVLWGSFRGRQCIGEAQEVCFQTALPTGQHLHAVWGSSEANLWTAGAGGVVARWNGKIFVSQENCSAGKAIYGIWGTSSGSEVWFVGDQGLAMQWNGQSWQCSTIDSGTTFRGVWGSDNHDIVASGENGAIWVRQGMTWQPKVIKQASAGYSCNAMSPNAAINPLRKIWGNSNNIYWISGKEHTLIRGDLNADTWCRVAAPVMPAGVDMTGQARNFVGIFGFGGSTTEIILVGRIGESDRRVIYRYSELNSQWTEISDSMSNLAQELYELDAVWGTSPSALWAVGKKDKEPLVLKLDVDSRTTLFDRADARLDDPDVNGRVYYSIWGTGTHDLWISGSQGMIQRRKR